MDTREKNACSSKQLKTVDSPLFRVEVYIGQKICWRVQGVWYEAWETVEGHIHQHGKVQVACVAFATFIHFYLSLESQKMCWYLRDMEPTRCVKKYCKQDFKKITVGVCIGLGNIFCLRSVPERNECFWHVHTSVSESMAQVRRANMKRHRVTKYNRFKLSYF